MRTIISDNKRMNFYLIILVILKLIQGYTTNTKNYEMYFKIILSNLAFGCAPTNLSTGLEL